LEEQEEDGESVVVVVDELEEDGKEEWRKTRNQGDEKV